MYLRTRQSEAILTICHLSIHIVFFSLPWRFSTIFNLTFKIKKQDLYFKKKQSMHCQVIIFYILFLKEKYKLLICVFQK